MQPKDFVAEADITTLRLENELLTHEVAFLRSRIHALDDRLQRSAATSEEEEAAQGESAELKQAKSDLRWMLNRINSSPIGWLVRRRSGFQNLWSRWVEPVDRS